MVTEYCDGGDLEKSRELRLDPINSLKLFTDICKGIAFAHENGVIHRDIKPSNILLAGPEKRPVVADFGICFIDEGDHRLTLTEEAVGPRYFMAPELEEGRVKEISSSSDIYSLGKLLYWLLTHQIFAREKHREPGYDLVKRLRNPKFEHLNRLLDRMIVADSKKRFSSATELLKQTEEVRSLLEGNFNPIGSGTEQRCIYCGKGTYQLAIDESPNGSKGYTSLRNFGIEPAGAATVKVFVCNYCGNVQLFRPDMSKDPKVWD